MNRLKNRSFFQIDGHRIQQHKLIQRRRRPRDLLLAKQQVDPQGNILPRLQAICSIQPSSSRMLIRNCNSGSGISPRLAISPAVS